MSPRQELAGVHQRFAWQMQAAPLLPWLAVAAEVAPLVPVH